MLRGAWSGGRGRRGAIAGASAVVLGIGGLLAACGGDARDGYVATGAAGGGPEKGSGKAVGPSGDVEFVPLDGAPSEGGPSGGGSSGEAPGKRAGAGGSGAEGAGQAGGDDGRSSGGDSGGSGRSDGSGGKSPGGRASSGDRDGPGGPSSGRGQGGGSGEEEGEEEEKGEKGGGGDDTRPGSPSGGASTPGTPSKPAPDPGQAPKPGPEPKPPGPAVLRTGEPRREAGDKRWCEDVTLTFRNTGGSAVRSGSVTFGTHIIGALGVDWGTIESTRKLPAPIKAGRTVKKTWPVCVDWWRVPLGMRIETRDVDVEWK
ncbi:hypothetical protein [Streptomyces flavofungini]|uniref:hypothetical protein n=1 Tax=Streptomyces flavofungini TaxID=68200 RepID=UPI0025B1840D|nr:hypothetical protein [Streptomyces flavofungini]WJV47692.1 hypothetical protein QUY26_20485 [Streptomyces flavofungini]